MKKIALSIIFSLSTSSTLLAWDTNAYRSIVHEPGAVAKSAWYIMRHGWGTFRYSGCNPKDIDAGALSGPIIICLQGDQSNPATFVPLIDSLRKSEMTRTSPIFVPDFSYDRSRSPTEELRMLLTSIQQNYARETEPVSVILIGHSMGGISSCFYSHCDAPLPGINLIGVIAISSPLKSACCPEADLINIIESIERSAPRTTCAPLYTVFGDQDWIAPMESLDVAQADRTFIALGQGHLSVLYHRKAIAFVQAATEALLQAHRADSAFMPASDSSGTMEPQCTTLECQAITLGV